MKIFELTIDEDDEMSGVEYLSLVKTPATEIAWEVFNDTKPHTCSVEGVDFSKEQIDNLNLGGLVPDAKMFFEAERTDVEIELTKEDFARPVSVPPITSNPNQLSFGDDPEGTYISRYIYVVDTSLGAPLIRTSRALCRKMILSSRVYSNSDLMSISQQLTSSSDSFRLVARPRTAPSVDFKTYKSGKFCRHKWQQIDFPIKQGQNFNDVLASIPNKVQPAIAKGERVEMIGRPFVSEWSVIPPVASQFSKQNATEPIAFHMGLFVYPTRFGAMLAEPTSQTLTKVKLCYDYGYGEPGDIYPIPSQECVEGWCAADIYPEYFEDTADVMEKFKVRHSFAKVPDYIREAAQRAVDYAEQNGWGDCGTDVGKQRAHDLARAGQEHSLETLTRMYSYGSRHKVDYESSKSIEEGCGYLMMLSWGFTPSTYDQAMSYLEKEIKKGTEMNVAFSSNEMKGDITAVVFQPNQKIYRYDAETNSPYFVFMSRETIRKMLLKFSRQKQGKGGVVNLEHSGMIFAPDDVYTYENWLVGDDPEKDKSFELFGRTFEPGTWMTTIHFKDKRMFEDFVLSNKTQGVSLEGMFQEIPFNFFDVKESFIDPRPGEDESEFIGRCASSDTIINEYDNEQQRLAVCYSYWREKMNSQKILEDKEMVDGVIDLLLKVKDLENRKEIAKDIINDFSYEGVAYDYDDFVSRIGISDFGFNFPEGTCWEGYEPIGTKMLDGREVPNCVPIKAKKEMEINTKGMGDYLTPDKKDLDKKIVENFKPYDWDKCISDQTKRYGSKEIAAKVCGKIRSQNMAQMGIYDGAPYYPYPAQAAQAGLKIGCEGIHFMEEYGWFPCKTHKEAVDGFEAENVMNLFTEMLNKIKKEL
jgi:hypothetical protein